MTSAAYDAQSWPPEEENRLRTLYQYLLENWNQRDDHALPSYSR